MIYQEQIFVATDTYSRVLRRAACAYSIYLICSQRLDTSSALPLTYIQVSYSFYAAIYERDANDVYRVGQRTNFCLCGCRS